MKIKTVGIGILISMLFSNLSAQTTGIENGVVIEEKGANYLIVSVTADSLHFSNIMNNGTAYSHPRIAGFGMSHETGSPELPCKTITMLAGKGSTPKVTILEADTQIVICPKPVFPSQPAQPDDQEVTIQPFTQNGNLYKTNSWYPSEPAVQVGQQIYQGTTVGSIKISPVQYNPVAGTCKLYRKLRMKIEYSTLTRGTDMPNGSSPFLDNLLAAPINHSRNYTGGVIASPDGVDDILIITHDNYRPAAEILARWERQKGYGVRIISKSAWTSSAIADSVKNFYARTIPKPGYLLIIGDHDLVPGQVLSRPGQATDNFASDLYYVCMDGAYDFTPDMAKGRISVNSATQANSVVNKIIEYEKHPITDPSFYKNATCVGVFQDDNNDGYEDRRFALTSETMHDYLISKGYQASRVYGSYAKNPSNWNNYEYAFGDPIPTELKKSSGFKWGGETDSVTKEWNDGRFLIVQRGHGNPGGSSWNHPYFDTYSTNTLTNGNKLPVVFSINCHSGEYIAKECLAETMLRKSNGGSVGVIAAGQVSFSGYNDALTTGMVDAIWPGISMNSPRNTNSQPTPHAPIYTMGDVLLHGLFRVGEDWGTGEDQVYTNELFNYFGDPTMEIWTALPKPISYTKGNFSAGASSLTLSNLNITSGTATLYNPRTDLIIGRAVISGNSVAVPVTGTFTASDSLVLTIRSHNYIPVIETVTANGTVSNYSVTSTVHGNGTVTPSGTITVASNANFTFTVKANAGNQVDSVKVNGTKKSLSGDSCTITNILSNQQIEAWFSGKITMSIDTTHAKKSSTVTTKTTSLLKNSDTLVTITDSLFNTDTLRIRTDSLLAGISFWYTIDTKILRDTSVTRTYDTLPARVSILANSDKNRLNGVMIAPNPARISDGMVVISIPEKSGESYAMRIYDVVGNCIFASTGEVDSNEIRWNLCNKNGMSVANGTYAITLELTSSTREKQFWKGLVGVKQ